MSVFESPPTTPQVLRADLPLLDEAQLAAAAFLARYSGRTLESYRTDLRQFFQWAERRRSRPADGDPGAHRAVPPSLDGAARAGAVHDRSAAVDGVRLLPLRPHRRPHHAEPGPVRAPTDGSIPPTQRGMDRGELAAFLYTAERISPMHAALAVLLGLERPAGQRSVRRQHRRPRLRTRPPHAAASSARATSPPSSRSSRGPPAPSTSPIGERHDGPILIRARRPAPRLAAPPTDGSARSANRPASNTSTRTCCEPRSSWPPSTPASRCATSRSPPATPTHAPPPSTTGAARTTTATPPTPSSPSSPAADLNRSDDDTEPSDNRAANDVPARPVPPDIGVIRADRQSALVRCAGRLPHGTQRVDRPCHPDVV